MPIARSALQVVAAVWMLSLTPSAVAAQEEGRFPAPVGAVPAVPPKLSAFLVPASHISESPIPAQPVRE